MAINRALLEFKDLNIDLLTTFLKEDDFQICSVDYDPVFDALYVYFKPAKKNTIVHYANDNLGLIYDGRSKQVIGVQLEAFKKKILPRFPKLQHAWDFEDSVMENFGDLAESYQSRKPEITKEVAQFTECALEAYIQI